MKPKIVLVTDSADPSGMGAHMLTLGTALGADFDIVLAAPDGASGARLLRQAAEQGVGVKHIDLQALDDFSRWLTRSGADLVHVHAGIGWEGHGLVRAASASGVPVVRTEHLPYLVTDVVQAAEYRAMLLSVDQRIAVSDAVAKSHAGKGVGPIRVVRNGVQVKNAQRSRDAVRKDLGLTDGDRLVLTVARFTPQKGYDLLIKAAPAVLEANPSTVFALVGTGPEHAEISSMIAAAGLQDRLRILGHRADIADLLGAADLFVLPSHFEGLSLALLEAAAAGLPIVATAAGGNAEALGAGHAFLVAANDADALGNAINRALSDPVRAKAVGDAARDRYGRHFTAERMAAETAQVYRSVLSTFVPRALL